jgi:hypothetical protein
MFSGYLDTVEVIGSIPLAALPEPKVRPKLREHVQAFHRPELKAAAPVPKVYQNPFRLAVWD